MDGKELEFEWDEAKAKTNLKKHKVSFLTGAAIFSQATRARRRPRGLWRATLDCSGNCRRPGLSRRLYAAWRKSDSPQKRTESEQK